MGVYTGVPVVACKLVGTNGTELLIEVGDTLTNVEFRGPYENPIVSGTVIGIGIRQKTGGKDGFVPAYDGVVAMPPACEDVCRADNDLTANFVVDTLTIEDAWGRHVRIPVNNILSIATDGDEEEQEDNTSPAYGEVYAAALHDNAKENPISDEELNPEDYAVNVASKRIDGAYRVEVIATGVKHHTNGNDQIGAWVGIGLVAPEGATSVKYAVAPGVRELASAPLTTLGSLETFKAAGEDESGKTGLAYYVDKCNRQAKLALRVQWGTTGSDPEPIDYLIDLSRVVCE